MRLAAIDIGTNSVHMIVVRVRADFSFEVIDREKEMVRLGAGGLDGRKMTREAMTAALQALSKFERLARSHQVDEILAAATSATREAENGGDLLAEIERQTGIRPRIITGNEEARLIHQAAVYGVDTPKPAVVIDIGGGSVEITLGAGDQLRYARSFKLGVIRLTERFVTSDPLSRRDERKMVEHIGSQVDRYLGPHRQRRLRSRDRHLGHDPVARRGRHGHGVGLGAGRAPQSARAGQGRPPGAQGGLRAAARRSGCKMPAMDPRRADLAVAGAVLLDTLLRTLDAKEITLCDLALREGLVLDFIQRNRKHIRQVDEIPDVRRRSALELAERCGWEAEHSQQVARLALAIFDGLRGAARPGRPRARVARVRRLAPRHRQPHQLRAAPSPLVLPDQARRPARLRAGRDRDHRPGCPLPPARPSRAAATKASRTCRGPLRQTVRLLGAILRLAESLDRSRHGTIRGLLIDARADAVLIEMEGRGDAELEMWAANRQLAPLERILGRPVRLQVRIVDDAEPAARPAVPGAVPARGAAHPRKAPAATAALAG